MGVGSVLKRIKEFYEQLYDSDTHTELPEKSNEPIPKVKEVKHDVKHMARGTAVSPDNILIDTIKYGNNLINKELAKVFSICLKRGNIPQ